MKTSIFVKTFAIMLCVFGFVAAAWSGKITTDTGKQATVAKGAVFAQEGYSSAKPQ